MTMDLNRLSGPQRKFVRDAFLAAFDEDELRLLLDDELDKNLSHLVEQSDLETMTFDLIRVSTRKGWTDRLIEAAERVSPNARIAKLRDALAAADALDLQAVDAEVARKRVAAGAGGLERMVRREGFADWGLWVDRMAAIGHCICSIQYPMGVKAGGGTGFLVADDLVLTNYHVIEEQYANALDPAQVACRFDFAVGSAAATTVKLHADWLVDHGIYSPYDPGDGGGLPDPEHLDYALLRLERPVSGDTVGGAGKRGSLLLDGAAAVPAGDDLIFIGQHPNLQPLKLGVGEVLKLNENGTRIRYDANTERGSSGSPCLDMQLNVVALHHGGDPDYTRLVGEYNQGIPIGLILRRMGPRLAARGVPQFWTNRPGGS